MSRDQIIQLAREAGIKQAIETPHLLLVHELERFHAIATTREREARQAAQRENEELKARLARAGLEQQRAVLAEREACAKVCEELGTATNGIYERNAECAAAIRARKDNT